MVRIGAFFFLSALFLFPLNAAAETATDITAALGGTCKAATDCLDLLGEVTVDKVQAAVACLAKCGETTTPTSSTCGNVDELKAAWTSKRAEATTMLNLGVGLSGDGEKLAAEVQTALDAYTKAATCAEGTSSANRLAIITNDLAKQTAAAAAANDAAERQQLLMLLPAAMEGKMLTVPSP